MAEYIDRESLLKHYIALVKMDWNNKVSPPSWSYAYESFIDYLAELPTADVVPKSEVDKTIAQWVYLHADTLNKLENAKAEVAKEIFEEIETALKLYKQYDLKSGTYFECYLEADIAELKKKYTEGET